MDRQNGEIDITKLKYVLYSRKSTTDESRQTRSIQDQITDCKVLIKQLGIHVVKAPITENRSAKRSGLRQQFSDMLSDIQKGKYDGIVAWHPDRLARNMLEAGMIIDMLDNGIIKDLRFVTHHFTNDASGKMLLGMAFVLSKQYSDDLSQKVTRGVRHTFAEGKTGTPKHGYIRGKDGYYIPDGKHFDILHKAWQMRLQGKGLEELSTWMNKEGYGRLTKKGNKTITMKKQILSEIFRDPFYYGILQQADQEVNLSTFYDFKPMVTEEEYQRVQRLTSNRHKAMLLKRNMTFYPFRGMITCDYCHGSMVVAPSKGGSKGYLYVRCDNKLCTRSKRSVRTKILIEYVTQFLATKLSFGEKEYTRYYDRLEQTQNETRERLQIEIHSKQGALAHITNEIKERALNISGEKNETVKKVNEDRINELQAEKELLEAEIVDIQSHITDPTRDRLTLEQFLNITKNAHTAFQSGNEHVKDEICRLVFLNLSMDEKKITSYQLKEPFASLVKQREMPLGRGGET
jgi:site-specific DNA recombinase